MSGGLEPPVPLSGLGVGCDLRSFTCGEPGLDDWFKRRARVAEDAGTARTYVVEAEGRAVAFHCLAAGASERKIWPGRMRRNAPDPIPTIVLGRLKVDLAFQGLGLGEGLTRDAMRRFTAAANVIRARAMVVHALNAQVARFHEGLGFARLDPSADGDNGPVAMFMAAETIGDAKVEQR